MPRFGFPLTCFLLTMAPLALSSSSFHKPESAHKLSSVRVEARGQPLESLVNEKTRVALVETVNENSQAGIHTRNTVVALMASLTVLVSVLLLNKVASFVSMALILSQENPRSRSINSIYGLPPLDSRLQIASCSPFLQTCSPSRKMRKSGATTPANRQSECIYYAMQVIVWMASHRSPGSWPAQPAAFHSLPPLATSLLPVASPAASAFLVVASSSQAASAFPASTSRATCLPTFRADPAS